ncbi:MAG: replicative DNA helicase [Lachnospiraceae bacterium]
MDEEVIKRVPPNSMEAERSVLAAMLMERDAVIAASEILSGDDFYNRQYGIVFECMVDMVNHGEPVDMVTVQNKLKEQDVPPETASLEFVRELMLGYITSANIREYASIVYEKALMRRMIRINDNINNMCYQGRNSADEILEETERSVFDLLKSRSSSDITPIRQVAMAVLDKIEAATKNHDSVTGIPMGFIDLDHQLSGLQPSDLILIAARPSMGKTAFALNIAHHMAVRGDDCVAIFSLEMSKEQLVQRMVSMDSNVDAQNLRTGRLTDDDWDKLFESVGSIGISKLVIDDTPGISVAEVRSKCRRLKLEKNLKCVMIDYLQLMSGSSRSESRQQEISDISRSLKALAREIDCPVIALSQLSRAPEQRNDHRPMLSDLRESGAIEQDADVVMFIYRDDYYNHDSPEKNISEIIVAKQRNGPTGTVKLAWLPQFTKFANLQQ